MKRESFLLQLGEKDQQVQLAQWRWKSTYLQLQQLKELTTELEQPSMLLPWLLNLERENGRDRERKGGESGGVWERSGKQRGFMKGSWDDEHLVSDDRTVRKTFGAIQQKMLYKFAKLVLGLWIWSVYYILVNLFSLNLVKLNWINCTELEMN